MSHLRKLSLLAVLAGALAIPASPASAKIQIGISDQSPHMFLNEWFAPLEVKYARIVVPYDILTRKDYWPEYLQLWLTNAQAAGVQPHVAFNIKSVETRYFGKGPTVRRYARIVRRFVKKYPTVRTYTPWNEANHSFQPTARRPKLAYGYHRAMRKACPTCKVLVADLLDDANLLSWLRKFKRYYKGRGTWGLHNYQDANKHRSFGSSWTYKLARAVKGDLWSTEAGGLVGFKTVKGRVAYKYSLERQLRAQRYLFKLMNNRRVRHRYKRVYIYNFYGSWSRTRKTNRWDSGLISLAGTPRPAYHDLKRRSAGSR